MEQVYFNNFKLYSKSLSLQHIYNVLRPISSTEDTKKILETFKEFQFDQTLLQTNQVVCLEVEMPTREFRMNEHSFQLQQVYKVNQGTDVASTSEPRDYMKHY